MTSALPTDLIVQRCSDKKWQYPAPIEDLDEWAGSNWDAFDPQYVHRMYWPDRPYLPGMGILVVDGGTTQGPVIARSNPDARVTATATSEESLNHAIYLRHKYRLSNLDLHLLPIDRISELNRSFDLVIASGVLQHGGYAEAQAGAQILAQFLRPEGVAAFLLYSGYLPGTPGAGYRAETAEMPLHANGFDVSAKECLDLVQGAGLVFQDWLIKSPYYLPALVGSSNEMLQAIARLPERQMWSAVEPLRNQSGCHLFTACRPERPIEAYRIDFTEPRALDYVPMWRLHSGLDAGYAVRPGWSTPLDTVQRELAAKVDGHSTIAQIAGHPELEPVAVDLFTNLWRMDFAMIGIGGTPQPEAGAAW
ncbi:MAG: class I SAM-dependent methyltransferase [Mycobacterium sp.]